MYTLSMPYPVAFVFLALMTLGAFRLGELIWDSGAWMRAKLKDATETGTGR
jgi:hypothetical protein